MWAVRVFSPNLPLEFRGQMLAGGTLRTQHSLPVVSGARLRMCRFCGWECRRGFPCSDFFTKQEDFLPRIRIWAAPSFEFWIPVFFPFKEKRTVAGCVPVPCCVVSNPSPRVNSYSRWSGIKIVQANPHTLALLMVDQKSRTENTLPNAAWVA